MADRLEFAAPTRIGDVTVGVARVCVERGPIDAGGGGHVVGALHAAFDLQRPNAARDQLREEAGDRFPKKVTAFRKEMAVHGKFGEPCPECGAPIARIRYKNNETNYCPGCQTDGRIFADRSLSRLLKDDWPDTL